MHSATKMMGFVDKGRAVDVVIPLFKLLPYRISCSQLVDKLRKY